MITEATGGARIRYPHTTTTVTITDIGRHQLEHRIRKPYPLLYLQDSLAMINCLVLGNKASESAIMFKLSCIIFLSGPLELSQVITYNIVKVLDLLL